MKDRVVAKMVAIDAVSYTKEPMTEYEMFETPRQILRPVRKKSIFGRAKSPL